MSVEITKMNRCRLCGQEKDRLVSIFEKENLTENVHRFLQIQIFEEDALSHEVCEPCEDTVRKIVHYVIKCQRMQRQLHKFLLLENAKTVNEVKFEEEPVDLDETRIKYEILDEYTDSCSFVEHSDYANSGELASVNADATSRTSNSRVPNINIHYDLENSDPKHDGDDEILSELQNFRPLLSDNSAEETSNKTGEYEMSEDNDSEIEEIIPKDCKAFSSSLIVNAVSNSTYGECTSTFMNAENFTKEMVERGSRCLVPETSRTRYEKAYEEFCRWRKVKEFPQTSHSVLLDYFAELAEQKKPSTLWAYYSMLKAMLKLKEDVDISAYPKVTTFIKNNSAGYRPRKAKVFTENEIRKFINEAPDDKYLAVKVAAIFGVSGALRIDELLNMNFADIIERSDLFLVKVPLKKARVPRSFTITGEFFHVVKRYVSFRPSHIAGTRFFVNFQNGKCTTQFVGKNKLRSFPRQIARYLHLKDPELYTGHSFRRTSATILANAGADFAMLERHGSWKLTTVAGTVQ